MNKQTKIKFCGLTRQQDVDIACQLNVDALGFNFYPGSKRVIDLKQAVAISHDVPDTILRYAVVVNPDVDGLTDIIEQFKPDYIQYHGDETEAFCQKIAYPYIKAIAADNTEMIQKACAHYKGAEAILVDTPAGRFFGGTGQPFDWQLLPDKRTKPLILAGGLSVDNVSRAIAMVQPVMVDVCSGIETEPGIKSQARMQQFIEKVRGE